MPSSPDAGGNPEKPDGATLFSCLPALGDGGLDEDVVLSSRRPAQSGTGGGLDDGISAPALPFASDIEGPFLKTSGLQKYYIP